MKTLIFDFDGTLADTLNISIKCANLLADKYDHKKISNVKQYQGKHAKEIIKGLELSWFKLIFYLREIKLLVEHQIKDVKLFPEIPEVIKTLSKTYNLGIVSSNSSTVIHEVLKSHNLDCFNFIHSDESLFGKHRVLKRLIKTQKLNKNDVYYIGDEARDIDAARKVGIKIIAATWGYNSKKILKENKPDFLIEKPEALLKLIQ